MSAAVLIGALSMVIGLLQEPAPLQEPVDSGLRSAVERFFATQEAEDADGYLALWSERARRPRPEMLKFVFDAGDDRFTEIQLTRVMQIGDRTRVRVSARRERTQPASAAGRPPVTRRTIMDVSLTFVREGGEWKLLREGPASDDLAAALLEAAGAEEREALLGAEPELLTERLLLSISRLAGEAAQMQNFAAAQAGYERMLEVSRRIGNRKYEGEALQNLGNAFYYQGKHAAALQAYEDRLAIERGRQDDEAIAAALGGIATIRYTYAEYGAALAAYREAIAIYERLGDDLALANALISTGNVLYLQGDFVGAIADYTRSRHLYRKTSNPGGEARALEGLGRVLLARGDYARALDAFAGVLAEGRARNDRMLQGNAALNMGEAHLRLGNLDVARATFEESRGHFEAMKDPANVGRAWQAVALADLMSGRFAMAEDGYEKSSASCTAVADQECRAGAAVGRGFAQTAQDKYADAMTSYRTAIELFTQLMRREQVARAQIGLSQALLGSGEYAAARQAAEDARQHGTVLDNDDVVWRALVAEARALRRLEDRDAALAAARAAATALEQQIDKARMQPANPVPRDSTAVFAALAVLQAEAGDAPAAFDTVERMRVHEMRIGLAGIEREISRGMTDAERDEERAIAVELVALHAQLARENALPKPDPSRLERLERSVAEAGARRVLQQQRLFERLPDLRIWRGLLEPATHADAGHALADADAILQFVVDDEDLLVLWTRRGPSGLEHGAHLHAVPRRALAEAVAKLSAPEVLKNEDAWRKAVRPILDSLPGNLMASVARSSGLIVIPHDFLWRVPFEALPLGDAYLADQVRVRYAHSLSMLLRVPATAGANERMNGPTLLIAAAPELHESVRRRVEQTAPGWILRAPGGAASEAVMVAGEGPGDRVSVITGADATETVLRERLPLAAIVHLGVPFRVSGASPLFSPMLLAGAPGGDAEERRADSGNNAALEAREVMNLELRARAVVLSDGAALSMREAADDLPLVRWAWRAAGAASLMVPRWIADADASDALLADFHARLRAGEAVDDALRAAQRTIRRTGGGAAPLYWAGWILIGDLAAGETAAR